jgi:pimeloyl-ACP methyl ester carboxylesterase
MLKQFLLSSFLLLSVCRAFASDPFTADPVVDPDFPPGVEELTITSGGLKMSALIYLANGEGPHPTVVLLHGFPGNEKNLDIAQVLRRAGYNVVFFHYRGAWGSEGEYRVLQLPEDTLAVVAYLQSADNAKRLRINPEAISLLGHSLGGYTALAAGRRADAVCVGAMSPANPGVIARGLKSGDANSLRFKQYADSLFMLQGLTSERLAHELTGASIHFYDTEGFGPGLKGKSVFMVVGTEDTVTPVATMFDPVVKAYRQIDGMKLSDHRISGDHSFSWSRIALTKLILSWLDTDCRG